MKDGDLIPTRAEVWAVAADPLSIYLVSADGDGDPGPWSTGPLRKRPGVPIKETAHRAVRDLLRERGELDAAVWNHSTGWAPDDDGLILTYLAVLGFNGEVDMERGRFEFVRDLWPHATPLTARQYDQIGQPDNHGPTEQPDPLYFHLLTHAIGHLRDQRDKNSTTRASLDANWRRHLDAWEGRLAGQYEYGPAA